MGNNIKLKYANLTSMVGFLKNANNHIDNAVAQLNESTDFGSSVMQAFWKFGSKKAIFGTVNSVKNKLKKEKEQNIRLGNFINRIDDMYENAGNSAKTDSIINELKNVLRILGFVTILPIQPLLISKFMKKYINGRDFRNVVPIVAPILGAPPQPYPFFNPIALSIGSVLAGAVNGTAAVNTTPNSAGTTSTKQDINHNGATTTESIDTQVQVGLTSAQYQKLEAELAKYRNSPYVYAGSSVNGIDCSGLVMNAYRDAGIANFPHKASEIYKQCSQIGSYKKDSVDINALKQGDLIFYSNGGTEAIKHVGIYVGNGQVMSALNPSAGVVTKSINYTNYTNIYAARIKWMGDK